MTTPIKISDEMVESAAHLIAQEHGSTVFDDDHEPYEYTEEEREQYRAEARAVAEAVAPLIAAQVLRSYADKEHPHAVGVTTQTDYGTGIEYDAACAGCGASWSDDEGGCTERAALLAAAGGRERSPAEDGDGS